MFNKEELVRWSENERVREKERRIKLTVLINH